MIPVRVMTAEEIREKYPDFKEDMRYPKLGYIPEMSGILGKTVYNWNTSYISENTCVFGWIVKDDIIIFKDESAPKETEIPKVKIDFNEGRKLVEERTITTSKHKITIIIEEI